MIKIDLHDTYVSASGTKIKMSPSFYFRWKDLTFQSNAFQKSCLKSRCVLIFTFNGKIYYFKVMLSACTLY